MVLRQLATFGEKKLTPYLTILTNFIWIKGVNIMKYKIRRIHVYIVGKVKSFFKRQNKEIIKNKFIKISYSIKKVKRKTQQV